MKNYLEIPSHASLGENPFWDPISKKCLWTDIVEGKIFSWLPGSSKFQLEISCGSQTGAFLRDKKGNLVILTAAGLMLSASTASGWQTPKMIYPFQLPPDFRYNDAIADPEGRIIAGIKNEKNENGILYSFAPGKKPLALLQNLNISNGMGFSPDKHTFYHTDSGKGSITAWDYHLETGTISNPRRIFHSEKSNEVPDGMTVDSDGSIFTALWGGGCILKITPDGYILERISLPAQQVSSVCFAGEELKDLFITSASIGSTNLISGEDANGHFLGGNCYLFSDMAHGKAEFCCNLPELYIRL